MRNCACGNLAPSIAMNGKAHALAINKNPAEAGSVHLRLNCLCYSRHCSMHREPFRCRYGFLRQREFQDAVVELGLGGRFVDLLTEREPALDLAVVALVTRQRSATSLGTFWDSWREKAVTQRDC